jgi:alkanesulfonate monooxygenase SsuD/methylene tetrahydromethanopterin reductase-like flavin-dependent oxidoreductase (luciferase family)
MACISPESFERAGELGLHLLANPSISPMRIVKENLERYRASLSAAGHDPSKFYVGISQEVHIADSSEEAQKAIKPYALNFHRAVASKVAPDPKQGPMKSFELYAKSREYMEQITFEGLVETHAAIFTEPKEAVERLRFYESELGITHHIAWMDLGGIPAKLIRRSMEKFGKEVIPAFREDKVGA